MTHSHLGLSILFEATSGRPVVLSTCQDDSWLLQCNGVHFISDPQDSKQIAVVSKTVNDLVDEGFLRAEAPVGPNRRIYLTDAGLTYCKRFMAAAGELKKELKK